MERVVAHQLPDFTYQITESAKNASWGVPMLHFTSGIVFLQYVKFCCQQAPRKSRLLFRLGTVGISLHMGQVLVDFWVLFESLQSFMNGRQYTYLHYEAFQTLSLAVIILIVQYHFARIAYATAALSGRWVVLILVLSIGACAGGLGTAIEYARHFFKTGFNAPTPLVIRDRSLALYTAWLGSNVLVDGMITIVMVKKFYVDRTSVRHRTLRNALSRLLNVVINTFSLTFTLAILSLVATTMPHIITNFSVKSKLFFQAAGFILNGFLSRIYLTSFFCSFEEPCYFSQNKFDSCVASMGFTTIDTSYKPDSGVLQQAPRNRRLRKSRRAQVQVTREVEITVEVEKNNS